MAQLSRDPDRRAHILAAALHCFAEKGFAATGIGEIRRASGASIGSIYHFFPSKEAIAVALFVEGVTGWTEASLAVPGDAGADEAIRAITSATIDWGLANAPLLRFMDETRVLIARVSGLTETTEVLLQARSRGEALLNRLIKEGDLAPVSWEVAQSVILGPVQNWLQLHRYGQTSLPPDEAKQVLSNSAWKALRSMDLQ